MSLQLFAHPFSSYRQKALIGLCEQQAPSLRMDPGSSPGRPSPE